MVSQLKTSIVLGTMNDQNKIEHNKSINTDPKSAAALCFLGPVMAVVRLFRRTDGTYKMSRM